MSGAGFATASPRRSWATAGNQPSGDGERAGPIDTVQIGGAGRRHIGVATEFGLEGDRILAAADECGQQRDAFGEQPHRFGWSAALRAECLDLIPRRVRAGTGRTRRVVTVAERATGLLSPLLTAFPQVNVGGVTSAQSKSG